MCILEDNYQYLGEVQYLCLFTVTLLMYLFLWFLKKNSRSHTTRFNVSLTHYRPELALTVPGG